MIVIETDGSLVLVNQTDHAHFSGELLTLWRDDSLVENPRRAEVLFAARHHDNGWREEDAAPRVDPETGRPYDFLTLPAAPRLDLWRRGVRRFASDHPYAAALIHRHALHLHHSFASTPVIQELMEEIQRSLDELCAAARISTTDLDADYPLIDLSDVASLVGLGQLGNRAVAAGRRVWREGDTLHIDPMPLVAPTAFDVPCRHVSRRAFEGDGALARVLSEARWEKLTILVA